MKKFIVLMLISIAPVQCAVAQTTTSVSTSGASAGAQSGSQAISGGGTGGVGASNFQIVPTSTVSINSTGSDLGKSIPLVTAPQMTVLGGEDSCLKSRSGGGAFSGFGASFGTMVMDNECNRRVLSKQVMAMGQPEISLAILCGSPQFWAASARVAQFRKAKGMKGAVSVCHNALPSSADTVSATIADEWKPDSRVAESKWSYPPRDDDSDLFD